jgi:hypothetical protein
MSHRQVTISTESALETIEKSFQLLRSRDVNIKKSDAKELIASLLGYQSSNELDRDRKLIKEQKKRRELFHSNGVSKKNPNIVRCRVKTPYDLVNLLSDPNWEAYAQIDEDYEHPSKFKFMADEFIVGSSKDDIFKFLTDFDNTAIFRIETCEEGTDQHFGGLSFPSIDDFEDCPYGIIAENPNKLSDVEKEKLVSNYIDGDGLPFFLGDRDSMSAYKDDWMDEHLMKEYSKSMDDESFLRCVDKYLKYMDMGTIAREFIRFDNVRHVELLIEKGAVLSEPEFLVSAARTGSIKMCQLLLRMDGDISCLMSLGDYGQSALHSEVSHIGEIDVEEAAGIFKVAKHYNLNLDVVDSHGDTPLHLCALNSHINLYKKLIDLGASDKIVNSEGETPHSLLKKSMKIG